MSSIKDSCFWAQSLRTPVNTFTAGRRRSFNCWHHAQVIWAGALSPNAAWANQRTTTSHRTHRLRPYFAPGACREAIRLLQRCHDAQLRVNRPVRNVTSCDSPRMKPTRTTTRLMQFWPVESSFNAAGSTFNSMPPLPTHPASNSRHISSSHPLPAPIALKPLAPLLTACSKAVSKQLLPYLFRARHLQLQHTICPRAIMTGQQLQSMVDKPLFNQQILVPAVRVPKQRCNELMRNLRGHTLDKPKLRCIVSDPEGGDNYRLLLLADSLTAESLPEQVQKLVVGEQLQVTTHAVKLDYSHFNADQVLKKLLPAGVDAPSSFETIGHVVHLNLREEQLPYKHVIGQVILDKNPHVKTVVNKVGSIENEYRVFNMELLAGEPHTETEVMQHKARFRLDFSKVYWNSRLEAEHQRLVTTYFKAGDVVVDMMAGIGPFAVPAAQQGCKVYANDLNPDSARYMAVNVKLNKVTGAVQVFNMDGRAFVRMLCDAPGHTVPSSAPPAIASTLLVHTDAASSKQQPQEDAATAALPSGTGTPTTEGAGHEQTSSESTKSQGKKRMAAGNSTTSRTVLPDLPPVPAGFSVPPGGIVFQHVVMNLPASAVEFLDAFKGAFNPATWQDQLPLIHVYTFKTAAQTEQDVVQRVESFLGGRLEEAPTIYNVRDVAPNKLMLCVTFRLPKEVAFHAREVGQPGEPDAKRQKLDVNPPP